MGFDDDIFPMRLIVSGLSTTSARSKDSGGSEDERPSISMKASLVSTEESQSSATASALVALDPPVIMVQFISDLEIERKFHC
mmetsp:Transcript_13929/g.20793  ORF Transcript_13929/g.20793 Transcript_13929/m.20793 type:complete len:83 (-) Transcript_13929:14-262(-)